VRGQQRVARAALAARERLELPRLLERIDAHLRVAADGDRHAGVEVGQRGEVPVAQAALGGRARDDGRAAVRQPPDVVGLDVDAVDDRRARPEEAGAAQQLDG
jgi:hypothetical protein